MRTHFFVMLICIALLLPLVLPLVSSAQSLDIAGMGGGEEPFTVSVRPQYPTPYGTATISLLSSAIDLANATMSVSVGGKKIHDGAVRSVAVPLGRAGSVTDVRVTVSSGGASYSQTVSVQPQDVVLVVEPASSAPPLYPGKPPVPLEGKVRIVAMANLANANGASLDPSALSYAWTVGGVRMANSSGVGKSAIVVASPLQYRASDVAVAVTSRDGSLVGGAELSFAAAEPFVRIYENDSLIGIRYGRALSGTYSIKGTESTLYAAPFGLPTAGGAPLLKWFLDGAEAQTGNSITLRPSGKGEGRASLSFVASASAYARASANLSLSFGGAADSTFFGL